MRIALLVVICVVGGADLLLAQHVWGIMKSKGLIREELLAEPASAGKS